MADEEYPAIYRFLKPLLIALALVMVIYGIGHLGDVMRRVSGKQRLQSIDIRPIGQIYYAESPDEVVLQLLRKSGSESLERRFMEEVPAFTLFGDGRVIFKQIGGYSWRETRLDRGEVGRLLEQARKAGVFQVDVYSLQERLREGRLTLRGLPSFTLRVNTSQHRLEITIYGLPDDPASLPHHLKDNPTIALVRFIGTLMRFDEHVPSSLPYQPDRVELLVEKVGEPPEGISPEPLPFELPLREGTKYDGGTVLEVSGEKLSFFRRVLGSPGNFGYFSSGGSVIRAGFRPALPLRGTVRSSP